MAQKRTRGTKRFGFDRKFDSKVENEERTAESGSKSESRGFYDPKDHSVGLVEGVVNQSEPFFLIIAGSAPTALLGDTDLGATGPSDTRQGCTAQVDTNLGDTDSPFVLQWLSAEEAMRDRVLRKLNFFLMRAGTENQSRGSRWRYMIASATGTSSNFYSRVHLQYVKPPKTVQQALLSWEKRSGNRGADASPER